MKSYLHCLIPFMPSLLDHLRLPSAELDPILLTTVLYSYDFITTSSYLLTVSSYNTSVRTTQNTQPLLLTRRVYWSVT
jgi:hypothetical protein